MEIIKIVATRCHNSRPKCTKSFVGEEKGGEGKGRKGARAWGGL